MPMDVPVLVPLLLLRRPNHQYHGSPLTFILYQGSWICSIETPTDTFRKDFGLPLFAVAIARYRAGSFTTIHQVSTEGCRKHKHRHADT